MGIFTILMIVCSFAPVTAKYSYSNKFNVMDYGAVGNGETDDSDAFQKAWEAICQYEYDGTSVLAIPCNRTFLLSSVAFEGPCQSTYVNVSIQGHIVAPKKKAWKGNLEKWISFSDVNGLNINGGGQIDGRGEGWYPNHKSNGGRPTVLSIHNCNYVHLCELSIRNSPQKHISINNVTYATVSQLSITAPKDSPNTDGIDISKISHSEFTDSFIGVGDDCISIHDSYNITITKINCGPGHGISIGSLGKNGEFSKVEKINVSDCNLNNTTNGVRIKTWQGGNGYARNINFQRIQVDEVDHPIIIDQFYCNGHHNCGTEPKNVHVSNVRYIDVNGTSSKPTAITLNCSATVPCIDILMQEVNIRSTNPKHEVTAVCQNAHGTIERTTPEVRCLDY